MNVLYRIRLNLFRLDAEKARKTRLFFIQDGKESTSFGIILILFVHIENPRAIRYYERAGFTELHKPYTDKTTGRVYKRMVLLLKTPSA